jgi:hypothetical protein
MKILSVHERRIDAPIEAVGALMDGLSGPDDRLWPRDHWPVMEFDAPLGKGAKGGHGPVRYTVSEHVPGQRLVFDFDNSGIAAGFRGTHRFEVFPEGDCAVLRHVIDAKSGLFTWLRWQIMIRPLHDACVQDAFDRAERETGGDPANPAQWSTWVKMLRWVIRRIDQ